MFNFKLPHSGAQDARYAMRFFLSSFFLIPANLLRGKERGLLPVEVLEITLSEQETNNKQLKIPIM